MEDATSAQKRTKFYLQLSFCLKLKKILKFWPKIIVEWIINKQRPFFYANVGSRNNNNKKKQNNPTTTTTKQKQKTKTKTKNKKQKTKKTKKNKKPIKKKKKKKKKPKKKNRFLNPPWVTCQSQKMVESPLALRNKQVYNINKMRPRAVFNCFQLVATLSTHEKKTAYMNKLTTKKQMPMQTW